MDALQDNVQEPLELPQLPQLPQPQPPQPTPTDATPIKRRAEPLRACTHITATGVCGAPTRSAFCRHHYIRPKCAYPSCDRSAMRQFCKYHNPLTMEKRRDAARQRRQPPPAAEPVVPPAQVNVFDRPAVLVPPH